MSSTRNSEVHNPGQTCDKKWSSTQTILRTALTTATYTGITGTVLGAATSMTPETLAVAAPIGGYAILHTLTKANQNIPLHDAGTALGLTLTVGLYAFLTGLCELNPALAMFGAGLITNLVCYLLANHLAEPQQDEPKEPRRCSM